MLAMYLTNYSLWARIDSPAIYSASIEGDFIQGFMFALSYLIYKIPRQVIESKVSKREIKYKKMLLIFICIRFITTTPLLLFHELRWQSYGHHLSSGVTFHNISVVTEALDRYEKDCGMYPTSEQGLNALWEDPNVSNWSGPYLKYKDLLEDTWESLLRYKLVDNKPVVWSIGRDHKDGTEDDIYLNDIEFESDLSDPNQR